MRVLVIGGTGFVGSSVCAALHAYGDEVVCADIAPPRPATAQLLERVPFRSVQVQDFHSIARAVVDSGADVIVALSYIAGAATEAKPYEASLVNLQGPLNCVEAAALCGARRVIYASSIGIYGPDQRYYGERDLTEGDSCPMPEHTLSYSASKAINEYLIDKLARHHGLDTCCVRLSIVFGHGREHGFTTWASDIGSLPAVGEPVTIPFHADQRSSLIYINDAADLLVRAVHSTQPGSKVYNSGGQTVSMAELVDAVTAIEPAASLDVTPSASEQPYVSRVSGARAEQELGFRLTPLDAALRHHMDQARIAADLPPCYTNAT